MSKKIVPAALHALKQALTDVYWYKSDLRSFLTSTLSKPELVNQLNWDDYKRNIVAAVVDRLARHEDLFQADLLRLMTVVARIDDFAHLLRLDDGKAKAKKGFMRRYYLYCKPAMELQEVRYPQQSRDYLVFKQQVRN